MSWKIMQSGFPNKLHGNLQQMNKWTIYFGILLMDLELLFWPIYSFNIFTFRLGFCQMSLLGRYGIASTTGRKPMEISGTCTEAGIGPSYWRDKGAWFYHYPGWEFRYLLFKLLNSRLSKLPHILSNTEYFTLHINNVKILFPLPLNLSNSHS